VEEEWAPADGVERGAYTLVTNILMAVGIALLLAAGFALTGQGGWRTGLYWGLAGYAAFILAPALGLPPEVPGAEAAPLADRQLWWLGTVAATAGGLALLFLTRSWQWIVAGAGLIVLPHLIGAPQPEHHGGLAPDSLAREFVVAVLVTGFLFWLALGALSGFFYKRFAAV
jgi:cobalt transporter subunit CbtA